MSRRSKRRWARKAFTFKVRPTNSSVCTHHAYGDETAARLALDLFVERDARRDRTDRLTRSMYQCADCELWHLRTTVTDGEASDG